MIAVHPLRGIGEIAAGDDLGAALAAALAPLGREPGDLLCVTQKIVSKAEARMVALAEVAPGARAREIAGAIGKDPRLVELILTESSEVLRAARGVLIVRHRLGLVMANAGIDASNLGPGNGEHALLLPLDPDASAARLAAALGLGVVITDSFGRPWRQGVVNVAIGCAGVPSLDDRRGERDRDGRTLQSTVVATADLIAAAAGLAMGEGAEGVPAALLRGLALTGAPAPAASLIRPLDEDLFR